MSVTTSEEQVRAGGEIMVQVATAAGHEARPRRARSLEPENLRVGIVLDRQASNLVDREPTR